MELSAQGLSMGTPGGRTSSSKAWDVCARVWRSSAPVAEIEPCLKWGEPGHEGQQNKPRSSRYVLSKDFENVEASATPLPGLENEEARGCPYRP